MKQVYQTENPSAVTRIAGGMQSALMFLLSRGAVFATLMIPKSFYLRYIPKDWVLCARIGLIFLLWIVLLWAERSYRLRALKSIYSGGKEQIGYWKAIYGTIRRLFRVSFAFLPFLFLCAYTVYLLKANGLSSLKTLKNIGKPLQQMGIYISNSKNAPYDLGLIVLLFGILVFGILLAVFWHKTTSMDFSKNASLIRLTKTQKKTFRRLTLENFLMTLPALFGWIFIAIRVLSEGLDPEGSLLELVFGVIGKTSDLLENTTLLYAFLVLMVLYLPLFTWRKMRLAKFFAEVSIEA